jgi:hypothetical protein
MLNKFRTIRRLLLEWRYGQHNAKLARLQSENDWHSHIKPFPWRPILAISVFTVIGLALMGIFLLIIAKTWPTSGYVLTGVGSLTTLVVLVAWASNELDDL